MRARQRRAAMALTACLVVNSPASTFQGGAGASRGRGGTGLNAIVGRVLDAAGRPVPGTFVTALRPEPSAVRGFRPESVRLGSLSNALGEYRLEGLSLGEYYVLALPHNRPVDATGRPNRVGFANTFHPGSVELAGAARVGVEVRGPATADIRLQPATLATVSGRVTANSGQPARGGRLAVARGDGLFGIDSAALAIAMDGSFSARGLQPGVYHLHYRESQWPPTRGEVPLLSIAKVVVAGEDVPDVRVEPVHLVRGTGRVVMAPRDRAVLEPSAIRVGATPVDSDGNPGPSYPGTVRDDLSFEVRAWPAAVTLRVQLPSREWVVRAIRLNGVDVTDGAIAFVAGRDVSGIEIEIGRR